MTSHIRHQVCKNSIVPDYSFPKTRRMVKNETKLKLKCFLFMDHYKLRVKWSNIFLHQFNETPHGKKCKMAFYSCGWSVTLQMPVSWYKYLIVSLVFSHLGFWSGNLFLIAPFPDLCLLVPFHVKIEEEYSYRSLSSVKGD